MSSLFRRDDLGPPTEPDLHTLLRTKVHQLGFENLLSYFHSLNKAGLEEISILLSLSSENLSTNFMSEGRNNKRLREYSMELLVRMLWSVPRGWARRRHGRLGAPTMKQLKRWMDTPALQELGYSSQARLIVHALQVANDIPAGWQPLNASDPKLVPLFDKHWP